MFTVRTNFRQNTDRASKEATDFSADNRKDLTPEFRIKTSQKSRDDLKVSILF